MLLVNHLLSQRDPKAALAAAQEAAGALPDSVEVMNALGTAQLAAGQGQQAISTFTKLAALRPDWPEPELRLADAHAAANDLAAAKRSLNKALQIRPGLVPAQRRAGADCAARGQAAGGAAHRPGACRRRSRSRRPASCWRPTSS